VEFMTYFGAFLGAFIASAIALLVVMRGMSEMCLKIGEAFAEQSGKWFGIVAGFFYGVGKLLGVLTFKPAKKPEPESKYKPLPPPAVNVKTIGRYVETETLGVRFWGRLDKVSNDQGYVVNPANGTARWVRLESLRFMRDAKTIRRDK
jgi:hypothetical protein